MVISLVNNIEQHNLSQKLSMLICLLIFNVSNLSKLSNNKQPFPSDSLIYSCKLNQLSFDQNTLFYVTCNRTQITLFKLDKSNLQTLNWLTGFSSTLFRISKRKPPIIIFIRRYFQVIKRVFFMMLSHSF